MASTEQITPETTSSPWYLSGWFILTAPLVLLCAASAFFFVGRSTLDPFSVGRVFIGVAVGSVFALPVAVIWFVVGFVIYGIGEHMRVPRKILAAVLLTPGFLVSGRIVWATFDFLLKSRQQELFVTITGKPWPQKSELLLWKHGGGLADKRHLWLFRSDSNSLAEAVRLGNWGRLDSEAREIYVDSNAAVFPVSFVQNELGLSAPWKISQAYMWEADEDAKEGPFGPGWLFIGEDGKTWCVWWNAM